MLEDYEGQRPADYGATPSKKATVFLTARRRMNLVPIFLSLFFPWVVFTSTYAVVAFSIHDAFPVLFYFCMGFGIIIILGAIGAAVDARLKSLKKPDKDPTWHIFLAVSLLLAWMGGIVLGNVTYGAYLKPYYSLQDLNTYRDVHSAQIRGEQLMDAGWVSFAKGSQIDVAKSMGFMNHDVYCVAPITMGDPQINYDIWVIGKNCCSWMKADFHCATSTGNGVKGGLRLLSDNDRPFYRLAVQQAEASHHIKANHPLFFSWVDEDPSVLVSSWFHTGKTSFLIWTFAHFTFQVFLVAVASLFFSKLDKA